MEGICGVQPKEILLAIVVEVETVKSTFDTHLLDLRC